jgi:hypothetical protein
MMPRKVTAAKASDVSLPPNPIQMARRSQARVAIGIATAKGWTVV